VVEGPVGEFFHPADRVVPGASEKELWAIWVVPLIETGIFHLA
jgi:hypothetical protein